MGAVLGIDAAWTASNPSGVAVATKRENSWHLIAARSSYEHFIDPAAHRTKASAYESLPNAARLLESAAAYCGTPIDIVAVDMPLARSPINARRAADDAVSKAYGERWCSTHTPNPSRPGRISADLRYDFDRMGFPLLTRDITPPGLIEVYPHPALVELAEAPKRLPYKADNIGKYWPQLDHHERRVRLIEQWMMILDLLSTQMSGVLEALPTPSPSMKRRELKMFEDALDAVVCVWVAICALEGRADRYGDDDATIWIPFPMKSNPPKVESRLAS